LELATITNDADDFDGTLRLVKKQSSDSDFVRKFFFTPAALITQTFG